MKVNLVIALLVLFSVFPSVAQNLGAVFGPVVNPDHQSFEYRTGYDPDGFNGQSSFAHRVHYQASFKDDFMGRVVLQTRETAESSTDFDFVQGELFWQLSDGQDYQTGLRFDLKLRESGRPKQVGLNWMNQFNLPSDFKARFLVLTTLQFDDNAADGIALGTRASLFKSYPIGQLGIEMYSSYGSTDDLQGLSQQNHAIGPFFGQKIGNSGWAYSTDVLFGLTDASADTEFRFRVVKAF